MVGGEQCCGRTRGRSRGERAILEIVDDCVSDFLRQWQPNLLASLAGHAQRAGLPFGIGQTQPRDITGSKSKLRQQKENRAVTPATLVNCQHMRK
jgi:hypothetical protein